jgi:hypothetical protein
MPKLVDFLISFETFPWEKHYAKLMSHSFEEKGFKVSIIDFNDYNLSQYLLNRSKEKADFTISFDIAKMAVENTFIFELTSNRHFILNSKDSFRTWYVAQKTKNAFYMASDAGFYKTLKSDRSSFMPFAIESKTFETLNESNKPFNIVFFSNYVDPQEERKSWSLFFSPKVCSMLELASEIFLQDWTLNCFEAMEKARQEIKLDTLGLHLNALYTAFHIYVTAVAHLRVLKALNPFKIELFGGQKSKLGWKKAIKELPHVYYRGPVSWQESLQIAAKSKIVLNISPFHREGFHERFLTAISNGSYPISTNSFFLKSTFSETDLLFYEFNNDNHFKDEVRRLLINTEERLERQKKLFVEMG